LVEKQQSRRVCVKVEELVELIVEAVSIKEGITFETSAIK
jgi:hypothetical protein